MHLNRSLFFQFHSLRLQSKKKMVFKLHFRSKISIYLELYADADSRIHIHFFEIVSICHRLTKSSREQCETKTNIQMGTTEEKKRSKRVFNVEHTKAVFVDIQIELPEKKKINNPDFVIWCLFVCLPIENCMQFSNKMCPGFVTNGAKHPLLDRHSSLKSEPVSRFDEIIGSKFYVII